MIRASKNNRGGKLVTILLTKGNLTNMCRINIQEEQETAVADGAYRGNGVMEFERKG